MASKRTKCQFQFNLKASDVRAALRAGCCERCSISASELMMAGQALEICGEEHFCDLPGHESYCAPVALCPDCHREAHICADQRYDPCHIKARRSKEHID